LATLSVSGASSYQCSFNNGAYSACAAPYAPGTLKVKIFNVSANVAVNGTFTGSVTANAGGNLTALAGSSVTLNGSASNGTPPYNFAWTQLTGPATVTVPSGNPVSFIVPATIGQYVFRLTVTDHNNVTSTDNANITVTQQPDPGGLQPVHLLPH